MVRTVHGELVPWRSYQWACRSVVRATAHAGFLILQPDHCAIDKGSWTLSSELSLECCSVADGEAPFSHLLDRRWRGIMLAHLRDADDYATRRRNLSLVTIPGPMLQSPHRRQSAKSQEDG